ncbi:MAG: beta-ketoacyl synthase N-terminal-like domain-containing protein [Devosia sp.]
MVVDIDAEDIAITGLACRFPGAPDAFAFWNNLLEGRESLTRVDDDIGGEAPEGATRVPVKGVLHHADAFDAAFFGIGARAAALIDPQHRVFLECAYQALEDAGVVAWPHRKRIGVFAGASTVSSYYHTHLLGNSLTAHDDPFHMMLANQPGAIANLVSYRLGLTGPSVGISTACSTGLVAVALAATQLLDHQCDAAIAGASSVSLPLQSGYWHMPGGILSPDGHCKPFTPAANGTVPGNGVGAVVMRRLEDAMRDGDHVYAILRGFAVNNDGADKIGYTAPGVGGQTAVITEALAHSGLEPKNIGYVETHGTGTALGDAIEVAALGRALAGAGDAGPVTLGAVKANIGHLDAAAGMAGLIKVALMFDRGVVPPSLYVPPEGIVLEEGRFRLVASAHPFAADGRCAGISSFGMGGTNAHAILHRAPPSPTPPPAPKQTVLFALSARTAAATVRLAHRLADHLEHEPDVRVEDAAFTLATARELMTARAGVAACNRVDAISQLRLLHESDVYTRQDEAAAGIVFVFPGQGVRLAGIARDLADAEPAFGAALARCMAILRAEGVDLEPALLGEAADDDAVAALERTQFAQPAGFALSWSLAQLLAEWGIDPAAMIGHSVGEYVAACLAGVMSVEDGLHLMALRGRLIQDLTAGAMVAVRLPASDAAHLIQEDRQLSVAAINGPNACVIAGDREAVEALTVRLAQRGVVFARLPVGHAFHSPMMDGAMAPLEQAVGQVSLRPPETRYVSTLSGDWVTPAEATDPSHYARHLREPVRFYEGVEALLGEGHHHFLELGAGSALSTLVRQIAAANGKAVTAVPALPDGTASAPLAAAGALWSAGLPVFARALTPNGQRIPLPPYPFERTRHWVASPGEAGDGIDTARPVPQMVQEPSIGSEPVLVQICRLWGEHLACPVTAESNYYDLGGDSLLAVRIVAALNHRLGTHLLPSILAEAQTPSALAQRIAEDVDTPARPFELVTLRAGEAGKRALFLPHAVGGTVDLYAPLAAALPSDWPIYGLQSSALDGQVSPSMDVAQNAARLLSAMRTVQSEGPYHLAGSSFGGMLAYEIARQLQQAGEHVALLALIDTPAMEALPRELVSDAYTISYVAGILGQTIEVEALQPLTRAQQIERLIAVCGNALPAGITPEELDLHLQIFSANTDAMRSYVIEPIRDPEVLFLRAGTRMAHMPADPQRAWVQRLGQRVRVMDVEGDHLSMMNAPFVHAIAAHLIEARARQP